MTMRRLWLIFAECVTVTLAVVFVVTLIRPDWNPWRRNIVEIRELATNSNGATATPPTANNATSGFSQAAKKAMRSVVNISSSRQARVTRNHPFWDDPLFRRFFGVPPDDAQQTENQSSLGSGVIVNADDKGGYVLTNHHVVESSNGIQLTLPDGRNLSAKIVGTDPETDLAVLRAEGTGLIPITFGKSDHVQVGDLVLAIGDPFGVGQTVTMGIVSAVGRNRLGVNDYENFIQTDAAINPGNSGGALVDINGNLIGINSVIYSESGGSLGIGFAIPVSMAKEIMEKIITTGAVTRGFIGIQPQDLTPELIESLRLPVTRGALVAGLSRGGPADQGGMKPGDVITAIDGKPVQDQVALMGMIAALQPGNTIKFKVIRESKEVVLSIALGKRPRPQQARN